MRKILILCGVLVVALSFTSGASAHCGGCDGDKTAAKAEGSCPFEAAQAKYDQTLTDTGCEKSAKEAYNKALAEGSYTKALAESGCTKTAGKAAYDAVLGKSGCEKSATAAAQHAVAHAAYTETLEKTGCSKTAQKAYDEAIVHASEQIESEPVESETSES